MPALAVAAGVFAVAIFIIDTFVQFDSAIAVLYGSVVLMSIGFAGRRGIIAIAVACMVLTVSSFVTQHWTDVTDESVGRCVVSLLAIAVTTFLAVRIQATTAALRSQAELLDLSNDAIFVRDMKDVITYWNRGAETLYGWTAKQAVGKTFGDLTQTGTPVSHEKIMEQLLASGRWEGELVDTCRDGHSVTVASRWALQRDERGQPIAILETNTDIDERKRAQDTIAKAQAELAHVSRVATLGELTASIAHEVNQPLAAIVTSGEASLRWLAQDPPRLEETKRGIDRMIRDGRRASEVVRRLRALAKKNGLQTSPLNLNEIIEDTTLLIEREVSRNDIALTLDLEPELPLVFGDRIQLQQVIINLQMNAIQAMAAHNSSRRELEVRSRVSADGDVLVAVRDSGPGFGAEQESQLFNAFFTTKSDGMGMGLSICRSIIEAHGGSVSASRNEGEGATFHFSLPPHNEDRS